MFEYLVQSFSAGSEDKSEILNFFALSLASDSSAMLLYLKSIVTILVNESLVISEFYSDFFVRWTFMFGLSLFCISF